MHCNDHAHHDKTIQVSLARLDSHVLTCDFYAISDCVDSCELDFSDNYLLSGYHRHLHVLKHALDKIGLSRALRMEKGPHQTQMC